MAASPIACRRNDPIRVHCHTFMSTEDDSRMTLNFGTEFKFSQIGGGQWLEGETNNSMLRQIRPEYLMATIMNGCRALYKRTHPLTPRFTHANTHTNTHPMSHAHQHNGDRDFAAL
jgi:hypothetical protein